LLITNYYAPPLVGRGINRCFLPDVCLSDVSLTSVAYIGPNLRTESPWETKIGTEVAHVTRDSDTTFKVKGQGYEAALVGCSSHYILYMDDTIRRKKKYCCFRKHGQKK